MKSTETREHFQEYDYFCSQIQISLDKGYILFVQNWNINCTASHFRYAPCPYPTKNCKNKDVVICSFLLHTVKVFVKFLTCILFGCSVSIQFAFRFMPLPVSFLDRENDYWDGIVRKYWLMWVWALDAYISNYPC